MATLGDVASVRLPGAAMSYDGDKSLVELFGSVEGQRLASRTLVVVDSLGSFCGYLTRSQVRSFSSDAVLDPPHAVLPYVAAPGPRLSLLRASYKNPSLTPAQSVEVTMAINGLIGPHGEAAEFHGLLNQSRLPRALEDGCVGVCTKSGTLVAYVHATNLTNGTLPGLPRGKWTGSWLVLNKKPKLAMRIEWLSKTVADLSLPERLREHAAKALVDAESQQATGKGKAEQQRPVSEKPKSPKASRRGGRAPMTMFMFLSRADKKGEDMVRRAIATLTGAGYEVRYSHFSTRQVSVPDKINGFRDQGFSAIVTVDVKGPSVRMHPGRHYDDAEGRYKDLLRDTVRRIKRALPSHGDGATAVSSPAGPKIRSVAEILLSMGATDYQRRWVVDSLHDAERALRCDMRFHGFDDAYRRSFPQYHVPLPGGRELSYEQATKFLLTAKDPADEEAKVAILQGLLNGKEQCDADREKERAASDALDRAIRAEQDSVRAWALSVLGSADTTSAERALASDYSVNKGVVVVFREDALYARALNASPDAASYRQALDNLPFDRFAVRMPGNAGLYGFGVVREPGHSPSLFLIPDEPGRPVPEADGLMPYVRSVLFFLCTERGGKVVLRSSGDAAARRAHAGGRRDGWVSAWSTSESYFDVGIRVAFRTDGDADGKLDGKGTPHRDIIPHAVRGTEYRRKDGTLVKKRPYWNHGAGNKRDMFPPDLQRRNVRLRQDVPATAPPLGEQSENML